MPVPSNEHKNQHYANFATTSRLVACLTSESLVPVFFVPSSNNKKQVGGDDLIGLCVMLRTTTVKQENDIPAQVHPNDILAVVPLRGLPIVDNTSVATWNGIQCPRIDMVDNLDMVAPHLYTVTTDSSTASKLDIVTDHTKQFLSTIIVQENSKFELLDEYDAVQLWNRFATDLHVNGKLIEQIGQELGSSINFQSKHTELQVSLLINDHFTKKICYFLLEHTYDHPKNLPTLNSSTIAWEQSVVEGHATHPVSFSFFDGFLKKYANFC